MTSLSRSARSADGEDRGGVEPAVSLVVVAFHRPASIPALVGAAAAAGVECVVVNVEDDLDVAAACEGTSAVVVSCPDNVGYGAAVNRGVARARGATIVFTNDDLTVTADSVRDLSSWVAGERADVAVPRVVTPAGRTEPTIAAVMTLRRFALEVVLLPDHPPARSRRLLHLCGDPIQKWRQPREAEHIEAASASIVAAPRELLRATPIPEAYFLYWEETEWFHTLAGESARVVHDPTITVVHSGGRADVRPDKDRLLTRNAFRYFRRTGGRVAACASVPLVLVWRLRLLLAAALFPSRRSMLEARWAGFVSAITSTPECFVERVGP